eukprot:scaffold30881_cov41-Cyclotella_meneghiniana.AAC.3
MHGGHSPKSSRAITSYWQTKRPSNTRRKRFCSRKRNVLRRFGNIRRCQAVLDRLCNDPLAGVFLEPVDTDLYPEYLEMIEFPMDLGTVGENLKKTKNYMGPEAFARDVRKVGRLNPLFLFLIVDNSGQLLLTLHTFTFRSGTIAR